MGLMHRLVSKRASLDCTVQRGETASSPSFWQVSIKNILLVQETTTLNNLCYLKHTQYFLNHYKLSKWKNC